LLSVYGSRLPAEQTHISDILIPLLSKYPNHLITGDLNLTFSHLDSEGMSNPPKWPWFSQLLQEGHLVDLFRQSNPNQKKFTFPPNHLHSSSSRLDYSLASSDLFTSTPSLLSTILPDPLNSDHIPVATTFPSPPLLAPRTLINDRLSLSRLNKKQIETTKDALQHLADYTLHLLEQEHPLEFMLSHTALILQSLTAHTRKSMKRIQHTKKETKLEKDISSSFTDWLAAPPAHKTSALHTYTKLLEKQASKTLTRKRKCIHATIAQRKGYGTALRRFLADEEHQAVSFRDKDGLISTDPHSLCQIAADTMENLGGSPDFEVDPAFLEEMAKLIPPLQHSSPILPPTLEQFVKILGRSSKQKAPGEDEVNLFLLSIAPPPLLQFIHRTITSQWGSPLPSSWKKGLTRLLYKKGDPHAPDNYRPISLLNSLYKVYAHHINSHISDELELNNTLSPDQYGFRRKHQTGDHLWGTHAQLATTKNNYITCFDLKKAFNSVPHRALISLLGKIGFHHTVVHMVSLLYEDALEAPLVNGFASAAHPISRGVRQGCPLSPTLFSIYIDPIVRLIAASLSPPPLPPSDLTCPQSHNPTIPHSSIKAFADDIGIVSPIPSDHISAAKILARTAPKMGLYLAQGKSQLMATGSSLPLTFTIDSHTFSTLNEHGLPTTCVKYLGVLFFANMEESHATQMIVDEAIRFWARFPTGLLTIKESVVVANSMLIPALAYRNLGWCPSEPQLNKVQDTIWAGVLRVSALGSTTPLTTRFSPHCEGGLGLIHFPLHVAQQFLRGLSRFQLDEGPPNTTALVMHALTLLHTALNPYSLSASLHQACRTTGLSLKDGMTPSGTRPIDSLFLSAPSPPVLPNSPAQYTPPPPFGDRQPDNDGAACVSFKADLRISPSSLLKAGCTDAAEAIKNNPTHTLIYTDGSRLSPSQAGGAAIMVLDNGEAWALAERAQYGCSYLGELVALILAFSCLPPDGNYIILCDNQALVQLINKFHLGINFVGKSYALQLRLLRNYWAVAQDRVIVVWIESHIGIPGNEYADVFANWACFLPPPPSPQGYNLVPHAGKLPIIGAPPREVIKRALPRHLHPHLDIPNSFHLWYHAGPFKDWPFKWVNGLWSLPETDYEFHNQLHLCICPFCHRCPNTLLSTHAGDPASCLTHCVVFKKLRHQFHCSWSLHLRSTAVTWFDQASLQEKRLYIRSLLPLSLRSALKQAPGLSGLNEKAFMKFLKEEMVCRAKRLLDIIPKLKEFIAAYPAPRLLLRQVGPDRWGSSGFSPQAPSTSPYVPPRRPSGQIRPSKKKKKN
jgi:ribonuclease HI